MDLINELEKLKADFVEVREIGIVSNEGNTYGFVMRFIDSEHLKAYAPHPAHQVLSEELQHICQKIIDIDIA